MGTNRINNSVPSVYGNFFLTPSQDGSVTIHVGDDQRPLIALDNLLEKQDRTYSFARPKTGLPIYFVPNAGVIVVPRPARNSMVFHRIDIDKTLEESGIDYLFATSIPNAQADRGKDYQYDMAIKSKRGSLKYAVEAGPDAMEVSADGKVTWAVPVSFSAPRADVILSVKDAVGLEIFQSFAIAIEGEITETAPSLSNGPAGPSDAAKINANSRPATNLNPPSPAALRQLSSIEPASLGREPKTTRVPSSISNVTAAGGGRYLLLTLPGLRQLAVFDMSQARIVKYLPLPGDSTIVAAGANRILMADTSKKIIQSYDLSGFQRTLSSTLPATGGLVAMVMGASSTGPAILTFSQPGLGSSVTHSTIDPLTLKQVDVGLLNDNSTAHSRSPVEVSGDGSLIMIGSTVFTRDRTTNRYSRQQGNHSVRSSLKVNADGSVLFSNKAFLGPDLSRIGTATINGPYLFATQPGYGLSYDDKSVRIHLDREARPLVVMDYVKIPAAKRFPTFGSQVTFQRLWFVPDAKHLVYIPNENDRVESYQADVLELLQESEVDYLFVAWSQAPAAKVGQPFTYQLPIQSRRGVVECKLQSGPKGMNVSSAGKISWNVPADFSEPTLDLLLEITDGSGQSIFCAKKIEIPEAIEIAKAKAIALAEAEANAKEIAEAEMRAERERVLSEKLAAHGKAALESFNASVAAGAKKISQENANTSVRTWTDSTGNQIQASLLEQFAGVTHLRTHGGIVIMAPVARLSQPDQDYLAEETEKAVAARLAGNTIPSEIKFATLGNSINYTMRPISRKKPSQLSWRVQILPSIGGKALYDLFDHSAPWDSEHNKRLIPLIPDLYRANGFPQVEGKTRFLAVEGPGTAFTGNQFVSTRNILDGTANSIVALEVPKQEAVVWTKPSEWHLEDDVNRLFQDSDSLRVISGDGKTHVVNSFSAQSLKQGFLIRDGNRFEFLDSVRN